MNQPILMQLTIRPFLALNFEIEEKIRFDIVHRRATLKPKAASA
jgi:hypothetical protein